MAIARTAAHEEVYEFLTTSLSLDAIIAFHPSAATESRIRELLDANRNGTLTEEERIELEEFSQVEHLVRMVKAKAHEKLSAR